MTSKTPTEVKIWADEDGLAIDFGNPRIEISYRSVERLIHLLTSISMPDPLSGERGGYGECVLDADPRPAQLE